MKDKKTPNKINQNRLVRMFKDIKRLNSTESRFCFLIGAGASKSSGIKTGWELSKDWYKDLKNDLDNKERLQWEKEIGFNEDKIGESYPHLYRKRYETSPQLGYDEFKKMMEPVEPDLGYVILSQILANEKHNFVITTNFDYLIEDAVRMYTSTKPFSAGHEMLAEFISSQTERPTIIKVHRDLFLHPFNDSDETEKLKEEWEKALAPILKNFNLLVIGYGGNDGSLMDYLKNIEPQDRKPIYWCVRDNNNLNPQIKELLTEKDFTVTISGFDELMFALNDALDYKVFENLDNSMSHPFVLAAKERISSLNEKRKDLLESLQKDKKQVTKETKELFTGSMKVLLEALIEKDIDKKDEIYKKGLEEYPNDADIIGYFANFLYEIRKDNDKAEEYYKRAIELDPKSANIIGNYATFLSEIRKDYDKAEEYYIKAIELKPDEVAFIGNYALFLSDIRKEYDKAEEYYKNAIELDSKNANSIANYALFLFDIRKEYDKAEVYYKKAIELKPDNADFIGNYANFLSDIRKDYDKAEEYYIKAIELKPDEAVFIGNYANFASDIRKDYDKAEECYIKAIELMPKDADFIGNYAHHIIISTQDFANAEKYITKALKLANNNNTALLAELWFYRYAHYEKWYKIGEKELEKLISEGAKSTGWNLQDHIEIAQKNSHPDISKLQNFAKLITE